MELVFSIPINNELDDGLVMNFVNQDYYIDDYLKTYI